MSNLSDEIYYLGKAAECSRYRLKQPIATYEDLLMSSDVRYFDLHKHTIALVNDQGYEYPRQKVEICVTDKVQLYLESVLTECIIIGYAQYDANGHWLHDMKIYPIRLDSSITLKLDITLFGITDKYDIPEKWRVNEHRN